MPMLVRAGRTAFASIDPVYGKTARSLGASDWRVFWQVELPLVWRPAAGAAGVAFARVLAELVAAFFIAVRFSR
jgi:molybdate transport system permease protein